MSTDHKPGWDKAAIGKIAKDAYGGYPALFDAHGWSTDGKMTSQIAPTRVVETYGSVEAFVRAHKAGVEGNALLNPSAAIASDPPDVWLKSFYGFAPEEWGCLAFSSANDRSRFLRDSRPGALVVIYGVGDENPAERNRVLGIQQQTHVIGSKYEFLSRSCAERERSDPGRADRWLHAIKVLRAWRIPTEHQPTVESSFPDTYWPDRARAIGRYGLQVNADEARKLLELPLIEVEVCHGPEIEAFIPGPAAAVLGPSRAGPVSQSPYVVREAEGPKHLYVLELTGNADHFLGGDAGGKLIVKVGMSGSPSTRCEAHNKALPKGAFRWEVRRSTFHEGRAAYPSSRPALAGEKAMKAFLDQEAKSLDGEFFLADPETLARAWEIALTTADGTTT
jgi:hypothetical protein